MSKKPNDDRKTLDLTDWPASGKEFEDLLDQKFANLAPASYAKHGRGVLVIQLADDNSWARAEAYLPADDLDDAIEAQHAALELIRLYDPNTQAVLAYSNEAGDWTLDAKVITIGPAQPAQNRKAPAAAPTRRAIAPAGPLIKTASPGTARRPAKVDRPARETIDRAPKTPVDRPARETIDRATKGPMDRPAKETIDRTAKGPVDRPVKGVVDRTVKGTTEHPVKPPADRAMAAAAARTAPMIECVRAEYCQQRVEKTNAGAKWIAVVPGGAAAFQGHQAADVADGALWFCSWACVRDFALALTQQQAAVEP